MPEFEFTKDMIGESGVQRPTRYVNGVPLSPIEFSKRPPTRQYLDDAHKYYVCLPLLRGGVSMESLVALCKVAGATPGKHIQDWLDAQSKTARKAPKIEAAE